MSGMVIKNSRIVGLDRIYDGLCVYCSNGRIEKISGDIDAGRQIIDAGGMYLSAGFIDLHIHGLLGKSVDDGAESYKFITSNLPRYGVTGYLPTLAPRLPGDDARYLKSLSATKTGGAQILGFHLEGPFLSLTGALPKEAIGKADPSRVKSLLDAAKPYSIVFSISPEFKDIDTLLPMMTASGMPAFITHTAANVADTQNSIKLGARHATHFYDVFYAPPETDPGVRPCGAVEAILADPNVTVDFILDGEHVDPVAIKMALECKGAGGVCLVTDASPGAGAVPGIHDFVGGKVRIKYPGGPARDTEKGCLAGSGLTMDLALANAIKFLGLDIPLAVRMASANPAKVLGLDNVKGQVKEGFDADLIIFNDKFEIKKTFVAGDCVYQDGD